MPTAASATKPTASTKYALDTAKQSSDQVLGIYRQAAKFSLDAVGSWLETFTSVVPAAKVPTKIIKEAVEPWVTAGFDVAEAAIKLQRELSGEAIDLLVAAGTPAEKA